MARRRRRRRSTRRNLLLGIIACVLGVVGYSTLISPQLEPGSKRVALSSVPAGEESAIPSESRQTVAIPRLMSDRPSGPVPGRVNKVREKGDASRALTAERRSAPASGEAIRLVALGLQQEQDDDWLSARDTLSRALRENLPEAQLVDARAALTRIGARTIFSSRILPDDPLVGRHQVAAGENLAKIAKRYSVTTDFLAEVNGIRNPNLIRAGQNLKVVFGPFEARVHRPTFRMDVTLQGVFVAQYAVGLGADGSTPSGEWLVGTKLPNPTYFPPRGGNIVAADDPSNPLGDYWIELKGVAGDALGQQRYGIHGTIEPDSIGRNASMGCVRMHNEDVGRIYSLLVSKKSRVFMD